ncbi:unnamed protein product [Ceratitis capitata]|uniref:(Mediterranean fruit fly) hypothetical protein n=1 Tax=Ceratitis capitata TaxID=7213 RepID=A0A811UEK9_CERCA|nr:unnamed protein product [Ceratitis capitata]
MITMTMALLLSQIFPWNFPQWDANAAAEADGCIEVDADTDNVHKCNAIVVLVIVFCCLAVPYGTFDFDYLPTERKKRTNRNCEWAQNVGNRNKKKIIIITNNMNKSA